MEEKLPAAHGEVRPEIADLVETQGWLPVVEVEVAPIEEDLQEPQRPETD